MPEIQPNKLSDLTAQAADLFKKAANKVKELKPEIPKTGAVANELKHLPKVELEKIPTKDGLVLQGSKDTGKTQIEKILGNEPIEGLVTQDISTMITPASDKAKLLKDVAEAEAKYKPNITTFIGDEPIKGVVAQDISGMILPKHNIVDRPDLRDK